MVTTYLLLIPRTTAVLTHTDYWTRAAQLVWRRFSPTSLLHRRHPHLPVFHFQAARPQDFPH